MKGLQAVIKEAFTRKKVLGEGACGHVWQTRNGRAGAAIKSDPVRIYWHLPYEDQKTMDCVYTLMTQVRSSRRLLKRIWATLPILHFESIIQRASC